MQLVLSYTEISYYLYFLLFVVAIFISFFIPGFLLFYRYKLPIFQKVVIASIYGIILWILQSFIAHYLGLLWLTYLYLSICFVFFVIHLKEKKKLKIQNYLSQLVKYVTNNKLIILLLLIGTIAQYSAVWSMGIKSADGITFCCRSVPDNLYHLALTNSLLQSFPPQEPGMAGQVVHNYYYGSHLAIADLVRIFHLPLIATQGNFFPLLLSLLFGLSILAFSQMYKLSKPVTLLSLFLLYFHSEIFYLISFMRTQVFSPAMGILDTGVNLVVVPPLAFGLVIFFEILLLLNLWFKNKNIWVGILVAISVAVLVSIKIYIAIFAFLGFASITIYNFSKNRRMRELLPFLISVIIAMLLYLPVNEGASGLFFSGFWRVNDFITHPSLDLMRIVFALQTYQANQSPWVLIIELALIIFYFIVVFNILSFSFFQNRQTLKQFPIYLHIFLVPASIITLCLGLFTLQKIGNANTIQFIIFLLFILPLYAALTFSELIKKFPRKLSFVIISLLLLLPLPRIANDVYINYIPTKDKEQVLISNEMITALHALHNVSNKADVFAVDSTFKENTYYVLPLLTNRRIYLTGIGILDDHGVPYKKRWEYVQQLSEHTLPITTLQKEDISYLIKKHDKPLLLPLVWKTTEIDIYKVK